MAEVISAKLLVCCNLVSLCLVFSAAAFAETAPPDVFKIDEGITFDMTQEELTPILGNTLHEVETEHTDGPVTFIQMEVKNTTVFGLKADVQYNLVDNKLVAVIADIDDKETGAYDKLKALFEEKLGGVGLAVDMNALGNGIFALEGDGKLDVGSTYECWAAGGAVIVVLEKEKDNDVTAYVIDLAADYVTAK